MKKKTIVLVAVALVLAILAIAAIATWPEYLMEDKKGKTEIDSDGITSSVVDDETEEFDGIQVGGNENSIDVVLPDIGEVLGEETESNDTDLKVVAECNSAKLKAENGSFPTGVKVSLNKLGITSKDYYLARHYTKDIAENFVAYKYSAIKDGKEYLTNGKVQIVINAPKKYDLDNVAVYYLGSDGILKVASTVNKTDKVVTVTATQPGIYILIEKDKTPADSGNTSSDDSTSSDEQSSNTSNNQGTESDTSSDTEESEVRDTMDGWKPWS